MSDRKTLTVDTRSREYLVDAVRDKLRRDRKEADEAEGRDRRMILADIALGETLEGRLTRGASAEEDEG